MFKIKHIEVLQECKDGQDRYLGEKENQPKYLDKIHRGINDNLEKILLGK